MGTALSMALVLIVLIKGGMSRWLCLMVGGHVGFVRM